MVMSKLISVVIPAYNEEENVAELHRRLKQALIKIGKPFEIIFVENGSQDKTFEVLETLSPIKIIQIRKNRGQALGIDAGLYSARGDVIITIDADLQNDPNDIGRLLQKLDEGYDIVVGWRKDRHDSFYRKVHSQFANWLSRRLTGLALHDHACSLRAYRKELLDGFTLFGELHIYLPAYLAFKGARVAEIEVSHHERTQGFSKHNFMRGVKTISDLVTVRFLATSTRPLLFFSGWGLVSFLMGFIVMVSNLSIF
jgi:glycosyltransferase involved in cell wall biosynthesis